MILKEAAFPITYCQTEVALIVGAARSQRSIVVAGLAGMGKSNLLRFIVSQPEVLAHYLGSKAAGMKTILVDCNLVSNCLEETNIFQAMGQSLAAHISTNYETTMPPLLALQKVISVLPAAFFPIFILDRFDQAVDTLPATFFNALRGLRDLRGGRISYILGMRRAPETMHELTELFVDPCILGPLNNRDSLESLTRDQQRLGYHFTSSEQEQILALSGGYPALRKNLADVTANRQVDLTTQNETGLLERLLDIPLLQRVCAELWHDLSLEEQAVLWQCLTEVNQNPPEILATLFQYGILKQTNCSANSCFSPLFAAYVRRQTVVPEEVSVWLEPPLSVRIVGLTTTTYLKLTPSTSKLLQALAEDAATPKQQEDLVQRIYGVNAGEMQRTDQALATTIKRLRLELNPALQELTQDPAYESIANLHGAYQLNRYARRGVRIAFIST